MLLAPRGSARQDILSVLRDHGIENSRVEFVEQTPWHNYLEYYRRVDIVLDTLPYNGHTTSLDALWMGAPVVTRVGHTVVGRAGWSHLSNLQLTELAAPEDDQFVKIATELAGDLSRLTELRRTLRQRMRNSPLTDAGRFARNVEAAYRSMWKTWTGNSA